MVSVEVIRTEPLGELKPSHGCLIAVIVGSLLIVANTIAILIAALSRGYSLPQLGDQTSLRALATEPGMVCVTVVLSELVFLVSIPLAVKLGRQPAKEVLALRPCRAMSLPLAAIGMLGFGLAGDWLILELRRLWPEVESVLFEVARLVGEQPRAPQWALVIVFSLLPAICEEALFRGVLLTALLRRWGAVAAVVATSLLFGLVHFDLLQSPAAILMGLYLGMLRVRTGSLWPAVVAHLANNLAAMLLMVNGGPQLPPGRLAIWAAGGLLLGLLVLPMVRPADEH